MSEQREELAIVVGQRVRRARRERGLTGMQLAKEIGKSQAFISDVERGRKLPSLPTLMALSQALEKSIQYFTVGAMHEDVEESAQVETALQEAMADRHIQAVALRIAEDFPSPEAKRFILQMIDSAKELLDAGKR